MKILFIAFLLIPFIEIYLLLQIGGFIGVLPTVFMVVFTAILGAALLRRQGYATWQRFQDNLAKGQIPALEMIEGPILLVGGALLLTPGFVTDFLGFACLIPSVRRRVALYIVENHLIQPSGPFQRQNDSSDKNVIEGEYKKEEEG